MKEKVTSALIDPGWEWGTLVIGETAVPFLTLIHPVHGKIVTIPAKNTLKSMGEWIGGRGTITVTEM